MVYSAITERAPSRNAIAVDTGIPCAASHASAQKKMTVPGGASISRADCTAWRPIRTPASHPPAGSLVFCS